MQESFLADVERAVAENAAGDLALFSEEIRGAAWAEAGHREIERAQKALVTATDPPHVLLFTGHRVDDPDRETPRFPADKVDVARGEIGSAIDDAIARHGTHVVGIGGAASGGDILFHEQCRTRGIRSTIFLALPETEYALASVNSAGGDWPRRYRTLIASTQTRVLQTSVELPSWIPQREDYDVWQRANLWMLHNALAIGGGRVTLIALWNGQEGDGPGGTADMVQKIEARGGDVVRLGIGTIFRR